MTTVPAGVGGVMFEDTAANVLSAVLGEFVEIDSDQLKVKVRSFGVEGFWICRPFDWCLGLPWFCRRW